MVNLTEGCSLGSFPFLTILGDLRNSLSGTQLLILILGFLLKLGSKIFRLLGFLAVRIFLISSFLSKLCIDPVSR